MAKLRKGSAYNQVLKRPYTRKSKYRAKNFIRSAPHSKVVRYIMGSPNKKFEYTLTLISKEELQIRDNALESSRQSCNKWLETKAGKTEYFLQLRKHPHHMLRDNVLASGAGADRMSTGMAGSYGKVIGRAAQVKKLDVLYVCGVDKKSLPIAKQALIRCKNKLPCKCQIIETKNN
jgi:large subunit ribosomal protein L10e